MPRLTTRTAMPSPTGVASGEIVAAESSFAAGRQRACRRSARPPATSRCSPRSTRSSSTARSWTASATNVRRSSGMLRSVRGSGRSRRVEPDADQAAAFCDAGGSVVLTAAAEVAAFEDSGTARVRRARAGRDDEGPDRAHPRAQVPTCLPRQRRTRASDEPEMTASAEAGEATDGVSCGRVPDGHHCMTSWSQQAWTGPRRSNTLGRGP